MFRILIVFPILLVSSALFSQKSDFPKNKIAIRREIKRIVRKINETRKAGDSQWSEHVKQIHFYEALYEYNREDLAYNPDSTIVFEIREVNNPSEFYGNDTIWVVFDSKSFCRLDLIDWFMPLSNHLPLLIQKHFPSGD